MTKKKAQVEIQNPDGSVEYPELPKKMIVTQELIEAWKRAPKEQALKEAIELYRAQGIDVSEARFKLDVLRFISELQGAQAPVSAGGNIIMISISQPEIPEKKKVIDVTASVSEIKE